MPHGSALNTGAGFHCCRHRRARLPEAPAGAPVDVTLKIAGIHWWFRTRSHAAELTAGYFNTAGRDGYNRLIEICAEAGCALTLTCVEMCDAQHPAEALCGPEGLLRQVCCFPGWCAGLDVHGMPAVMAPRKKSPHLLPPWCSDTTLAGWIMLLTRHSFHFF